MKLILTNDVANLGPIGTLVNVRNGYARNFLIPRSLAVPANESNAKELEHRKRSLAKKREKLLSEVRALAAQIEKLTLQITKPVGEEERIFGTVTTAEIAEHLESKGIKIQRKEIAFDEEVKKIGSYTATIRLHSEVSVKVKFNVAAQAA